MGFDQAYVRFYNEPCGKNDKFSLFKICTFITLLFFLIVALVVSFGWKYFSINIIGYPSFLISISLIIYLVATLFSRFCNLKSRMENNVKLFCFQSVVSTIITKISFVIVAIHAPKAELAIHTRSYLFIIAFALFYIYSYRQLNKHKADISKPVVKELARFAIPLFPTTFLVMLNASLALIILKYYVNYVQLGIYANAVSIAAIITIVQSGLNAFWTPFVYEYYKEPRKIQRMHHIFSFLMFLMAFCIIIFQDLIYYFLVDKEYWDSKSILAFLLISPVCDVLSETLGLGIELSKKTYLKLPVYIINILTNVLSCIILIPKIGILGAAIANAMASLSMLITRTVIGERYYRCSNNYVKLIISMIFLFGTGIINYYYHKYVYMFVIISLIAVLTLYFNEFLTLKTQGIFYLKNKFRKNV